MQGRRYGTFAYGTEPAQPDTFTTFREVAAAGWCWCLVREPDDTWTLRRRDWRTGELSDPVHTSGQLPGYGAAIDWAEQHVQVLDWTGDQDMMTDAAYQVFRKAMTTAARAA